MANSADASVTNPQNVISLNLTDGYACNWGTWEGVREIVQNWHDGLYEGLEQLKADGPIKFEQNDKEYLAYVSNEESSGRRIMLGFIHYDWLNEKLYLVNKQTCLQRKILLLGYSKKAHSKSVIGQFGEGLKVGALALVREGRDVTMVTGEDIWKFELRKDEQLQEKVLSVRVRRRDTEFSDGLLKRELEPDDTLVRISLEENCWKKMKKRFLFLHPPTDYVTSEIGSLILDEDLRSQLFVKGTWVADHSTEDLFAGVDFVNLNVDRDRNAVPKPSEIDSMVSCMWMQAVKSRQDLVQKYYDLLINGKYRDVRQALLYGDNETLDLISQYFFELHGASAYAVAANATGDDLKTLTDSLHKKIIICNETLLRILIESGSQIPLATLLADKTKNETKNQQKIVPYMELTDVERDVLRHAVKMIESSQLGDLKLEQIDAMEMKDSNERNGVTVMGSRLRVPRWMLNKEVVHRTVHGGSMDPSQCLCTVTHLVLCLGNACPMRRVNISAYDDLRSNTGTAAWVFNVLLNMTQQVCVSATQFCLELHQQNSPGVATSHLECVEREKEYQAEIQSLNEKMENIQESTRKELQSVQDQFKQLEKELIDSEMKIVNSEDRLKKYYEKELIAEKDKRTDLIQTVDYWKRIWSEELKLREETQASVTRKEKILLEELNLYVKQCRKKTDLLQRFVGDQANLTESEKDKRKLIDIQDLMKSITEDLQESHFLCNVCFQHRKSHMFLNCGHYAFCEKCADQLFTSDVKCCPICKCEIVGVLRIYE